MTTNKKSRNNKRKPSAFGSIIPKKPRKGKETAEVLRHTVLYMGVALAGGLTGAALGKLSLAAGALTAGYGIYTNNTYLLAAGLGMAVGHSSSEKSMEAEKQDGYFSLSATGKRIENFTGSLAEKFFSIPPQPAITTSTISGASPVIATPPVPQPSVKEQEPQLTQMQDAEKEAGKVDINKLGALVISQFEALQFPKYQESDADKLLDMHL